MKNKTFKGSVLAIIVVFLCSMNIVANSQEEIPLEPINQVEEVNEVQDISKEVVDEVSPGVLPNESNDNIEDVLPSQAQDKSFNKDNFLISKITEDEWMIDGVQSSVTTVYIPSYTLEDGKSIHLSIANLSIFDTCKSVTVEAIANPLNPSEIRKVGLGTTTLKREARQESSMEYYDLNGLDTSKVTDMYNAFSNLNDLKTLHVEDWDVSNVTNMIRAFADCGVEGTLDLNRWDMSRVESIAAMFYNAVNLKEIKLSNWDISNVFNISAIFMNDKNLEKIDVSQWNTSKVITMGFVFSGCFKLPQLDVANWDTSSVESMMRMFGGMESLQSLDLSKWNTSSLRDANGMFESLKNVKELDLSNWDTSQLTECYGMFAFSDIEKLNISGWKTHFEQQYRWLFTFNNKLYEINLGPDFRFPELSKLAESLEPYYGSEWNHENRLVYNTTEEFTKQYDGSKPGVYTRVGTYRNITFDVNGIQTTVQGRYGQRVPMDRIPKTLIKGYDFKGWNISKDGSGVMFDPLTTELTEEITVYAQFDLSKYTVTFEDDGTVLGSASTTYEKLLNESDIPSNPNKDGYTFIGWNTKSDGTGEMFDPLNSYISESMSVYATYKEDNKVIDPVRPTKDTTSPKTGLELVSVSLMIAASLSAIVIVYHSYKKRLNK